MLVLTTTTSELTSVTLSPTVGTTPPDQVAATLQLPPPVPFEEMFAAKTSIFVNPSIAAMNKANINILFLAFIIIPVIILKNPFIW